MSIAKLPKVASQFEEQLKPKPEKKAVDFNSKEVQDFIESAPDGAKLSKHAQGLPPFRVKNSKRTGKFQVSGPFSLWAILL